MNDKEFKDKMNAYFKEVKEGDTYQGPKADVLVKLLNEMQVLTSNLCDLEDSLNRMGKHADRRLAADQRVCKARSDMLDAMTNLIQVRDEVATMMAAMCLEDEKEDDKEE